MNHFCRPLSMGMAGHRSGQTGRQGIHFGLRSVALRRVEDNRSGTYRPVWPAPWRPPWCDACFGKRQMWSALMASLQIFCFLTDFLGTNLSTAMNIYRHLSTSANLYFPQSVKIHNFCSDPISVDPICPFHNNQESTTIYFAILFEHRLGDSEFNLSSSTPVVRQSIHMSEHTSVRTFILRISYCQNIHLSSSKPRPPWCDA